MKWKTKGYYEEWYFRFSLLPKICDKCEINFWLEKYLVKKEVIVLKDTRKKVITRKYFCSDCDFAMKKNRIKTLAQKIKETEQWISNPFRMQQLLTGNMALQFYNPTTQTFTYNNNSSAVTSVPTGNITIIGTIK